MDQYIPYFRAKEFPELNRLIINEEYQEAINLTKKIQPKTVVLMKIIFSK